MPTRIEEWEIGAFVDGELGRRRREEITAAAESDPELRDRLEAYAAHHDLFGRLAEMSLPEDTPSPEQSLAAKRVATAIAWKLRLSAMAGSLMGQARAGLLLAVGAMAGWGMTAAVSAPSGDPTSGPLAFVDEATEAHRTITLAPMFATDVGTVDFAALSAMFSEIIDPSSFQAVGLTLRKVDVAPTDNGPAVVMLFFDAEQHPVSLLLSVNRANLDAVGTMNGQASVTTYNDLAVAFGREDGLAFAITAPLPERRVREIAGQMIASIEF